MNYCFIENNTIVEGPKALPNGWRNISGLCYLSDPELKELGWLPYHVVDNGGEVPDGATVEIGVDKVTETRLYRAKTQEEIDRETEEKKTLVRRDRNSRLTACDWTQLDDTPLSNIDKANWADYRQALRDVPSQPGFPNNVVWPPQPA